MEAYTYTIKHIPTDTIYYGVRKSPVYDLGTIYFSSSKLVHRLLEVYPITDFEFKLRRVFSSYQEARLHESKLLKRIKTVNNKKFLNQAVSAPYLPTKDAQSELRRRVAISNTMKEIWQDAMYRDTRKKLSSEHYSNIGRKGATQRAINYKNGTTQRKKKQITYSDVTIMRGAEQKTIKANQVPAYAKYGWSRV